MAEDIVFTFYTYSNAGVPTEERWKPTGIPDTFFDSREEAQRTVLEMRDDVTSDPEMEWPVMNLEKVVTVPVNQASILALLNQGLGAFVQEYEVIECIGSK
ncbi:hypothetical protein [Agrobacterium sp. MCAB5]|uniref:hypothetical protein n=1 Tax=Agrobacterium sp. MCAB5 TaxID=3233042 RepID=UPI003F925CEF